MASYKTSSYSRSTRRTALEDSAVPRKYDNDSSSRYSSSLVSRAPSVGRFSRSLSVDPSSSAGTSLYEFSSSTGRKSSIDYSRTNSYDASTTDVPSRRFSRATSVDYSTPKGISLSFPSYFHLFIQCYNTETFLKCTEHEQKPVSSLFFCVNFFSRLVYLSRFMTTYSHQT